MQYLLKTTTLTKISLFGLLISTVLIASCTQNDKLEKANNELSKEVAELKKRLEVVDHSIIIPYDSLRSYMGPVSFQESPNSDVLNILAWKKMPENMSLKWVFLKDGKADFSTEYDALSRLIENAPSSSIGCYMTLPNGNLKVQYLEPSSSL